VRLPRDWLGPREELVPVGRAAGPVAPFGDDGLPPTADAFWSEDSAALHDALQAPPAQPTSQQGAPASPLSGPPLARPPWRSRTRRLSIPRLPASHLRPSPRWALLTLPIGALLVLALLGSAAKPASPPARGPSAAAAALTQAVTRDPATKLRVTAPATHSAGQRRVAPRRRHRGNAASPARTHHAPSHATRRTHSPSHGSGSSSSAPPSAAPASSTYVAAPTGSSGTSDGTSSPSEAPSSAGADSTVSPSANHTATSASHTAFGENGSLGPGSSPDS
jgi:hypothetical protein